MDAVTSGILLIGTIWVGVNLFRASRKKKSEKKAQSAIRVV